MFSGLAESDFKNNVTDTNWRSRSGLAGLVSQHLSNMSGAEFTSWAIYRRPQFFVYPPHLPMFNQAEGVKLPKFVVQLDSKEVVYGFYIEKSDKTMDDAWYWPRFISLLSLSKWQDQLTRTMADLGLNWILRFEERLPGTDTFTFSTDTVIKSFGEDNQFLAFSDFVAYLHSLPDQLWCNLFIAKTMDKQEAISLKAGISQPISRVLSGLAPMYSQLLLQPGVNT